LRCIETRKRDGFTYRRYVMPDGTTRAGYEITDPSVRVQDISALIRKARRATVGKSNLNRGTGRGISADPDRIDAVLEDIENPELKVREICAKHGISTKTYYKILRGV